MKNHTDLIMPAALPGSHEMNLDPITLAFPGDLEASFLEDYYNKSLKLVRISLLAGIFLYGLFGILDASLLPEYKKRLLVMRFAIVVPYLAGVILFSYSSYFKKNFQFSVSTAMVVSGLGIIVMISIAPAPVSYTYYAGLILVFIWGYSFTRLRFVSATVAGWIIVIFYEITAIYIKGTPSNVLLSNNFFFISANIIGMFVCYSIEYYARANFFITYLLENEQEKIKAANRRLEDVVQSRTEQLLQINKNLRQEVEKSRRLEEKRSELEIQLQRSQKLEAIGTLAGGVAHDFNNLLMGIQGNTSIVLSRLDPDDRNYKKLLTAQSYIKKSADLARQLLGFARGGKYEVETADLNKLIGKNAKMFGRTRKEITIYSHYQEDAWMVDVDRGQIDQVLLNLFVNAAQAMPKGGNLYIRTENIHYKANSTIPHGLKAGRYLKTSVTDTGIGMDKETQHKAFDPFFTTKEMGRGTGLGLASAYGIIKSHGGIIEITSEKDKGSTFDIYLPATKKERKTKKEIKEPALTGNEKILLVDDEEMIISEVSGMLNALGYHVRSAKSGQEAVRVLAKNRDEIDMVILDMVMPQMNGSQTYDRLKKVNPDVKVLLASGYSINGSAREILERGCNGFIQKPFDLLQLSQKVRKVLEVES